MNEVEQQEKIYNNIYTIENYSSYMVKFFSLFFIFLIINFITIDILTESVIKKYSSYIYTFSILSIFTCIYSTLSLLRIDGTNKSKINPYKVIGKATNNLMIFEILFYLFIFMVLLIPTMMDGFSVTNNPYIKVGSYLQNLSYAVLSLTVFLQTWFIANKIYYLKKDIYFLEGFKLDLDEVIGNKIKNILFGGAVLILCYVFAVRFF